MLEQKKRNLVFYRSTEYPDYYLLFCGSESNQPEKIFRRFTHTGEYWNTGYPYADVKEIACIIKTEHPLEISNFIAEHIATNHIPHPNYHRWDISRAWYELKTLESEKWLQAYEDFKEQQERKKNAQPVQLKLF